MDVGRLDRLRRTIKIGDKIWCRRTVKSLTALQCLEEKEEQVQIVGKYPNLVEVKGPGQSFQRRTVSYAEMLMNENSYMLKGNQKLMYAVRS